MAFVYRIQCMRCELVQNTSGDRLCHKSSYCAISQRIGNACRTSVFTFVAPKWGRMGLTKHSTTLMKGRRNIRERFLCVCFLLFICVLIHVFLARGNVICGYISKNTEWKARIGFIANGIVRYSSGNTINSLIWNSCQSAFFSDQQLLRAYVLWYLTVVYTRNSEYTAVVKFYSCYE